MSKPKAAIVLAGCGFLDGAEIQEAVLANHFLLKNGFETSFFAPDKDQHHVVDHLTSMPTGEKRNVLVESARIARGKIAPVTALAAANFDALVMPGGFGAAKNLSDYAFKGAEASLDPAIATIIRGFHSLRKPILAICVSPVIVALALSDSHPTVTIGDDESTISDLGKIGAYHQACPVDGFAVDPKNRIITTPAYMYASNTYDVGRGIEAAVGELVRMLGSG